jgi:hypothetical protein
MGSIAGNFNCTQGPTTTSGTFQASEIEAGYGGMIMRYETRYGACTETGRIGGLKP